MRIFDCDRYPDTGAREDEPEPPAMPDDYVEQMEWVSAEGPLCWQLTAPCTDLSNALELEISRLLRAIIQDKPTDKILVTLSDALRETVEEVAKKHFESERLQ